MQSNVNALLGRLEHAGVGFAFAVLVYVALAGFALSFCLPVVWFDGWDLVPFLRAADEGTLALGDLFTPHGGHWHASGYAVMVPLAHWTAFDHRAEVAVSLVVAAASFLVLRSVLVGVLRASGGEAVRGAGVLSAVLALFVFGADQGVNWIWGWQVAVHLTVFGVVVSIAALTRARLGVVHVVVGVAGAGLAVAGFTTGLAVVPVGTLLVLLHPGVRGARRGVAIGLWLLGVVALVAAFVVVVDPLGRPGAAGAGEPVGLAGAGWFAAAMLGVPVARQVPELGPYVFPLALAVVAPASIASLRRPAADGHGAGTAFVTPQRFAAFAPPLALIAFGVGAALMIGVGRAEYGAAQARLYRYVTFTNFVWFGVLTLAVAQVWRLRDERRIAWACLVLLTIACIGKTASSLRAVRRMAGQHAVAAEAAATLRASYPDPGPTADALRAIASPDQDVRASLEWLRAKGWNVFARD